MGRLTELETTQGSTEIMKLSYGYDLASNRVSMVSTVDGESDTFDYGIDKSGRLIEESINRLVERREEHFLRGEFELATVDQDAVEMLPFSDSFDGESIDADRWRLVYWDYFRHTTRLHGIEVTQKDGLHLAYPVGYHDQVHSFKPPAYDGLVIGSNSEGVWCAAEHRQTLDGDFDISVDFEDFQALVDGDDSYIELMVSYASIPIAEPVPVGTQVYEAVAQIKAESSAGGAYRYLGSVRSDTNTSSNEVATTDTVGTLRLVRSGNTMSSYYWDSGSSSWQLLASRTDFSIATELYVRLKFSHAKNYYSHGAFKDFGYTSSSDDYPTESTYTSATYDAGRAVDWGQIRWSETKPTNTDVEFQVAVSNDPAGPWTFVGPDGTGSTRFTDPAGEVLLDAQNPQQPLNGKYMRYKAYLTSDGSDTPSFTDVQLSYAGQNTSTLQLYGYDAGGNMTSKDVITDTETIIEVRTYNDLNQIVTNVVDDGDLLGPKTWTFSHDLNGNMTGKVMTQEVLGVPVVQETWVYVFDEDNRLIRVDKNSVTQVAYEYDYQGRLMARNEHTGGQPDTLNLFEWTGWTVNRVSTDGGSTLYQAPEGKVFTVEQSAVLLHLHSDPAGSIKAISDEMGSVSAHYELDAWGNSLSSTSGLAGNLLRYLGAFGVLFDSSVGLHYIRQRWYDSRLQRFVSRDRLMRGNRYRYGRNNPPTRLDISGFQDVFIGSGENLTPIDENIQDLFQDYGDVEYDAQVSEIDLATALFHTEDLFVLLSHNYPPLDLYGGDVNVLSFFKKYRSKIKPKIIVLAACRTGAARGSKGQKGENPFEELFPSDCGQTMVGFSDIAKQGDITLFLRPFLEALSRGQTVTEAIESGLASMKNSGFGTAANRLRSQINICGPGSAKL